MDVYPVIEELQDRLVHGSGITFDRRFKLQPFAHRHDRHAMPA